MALLISNVAINMFYPPSPWIGDVVDATSTNIIHTNYTVTGIYSGSRFKYKGYDVVAGTLKGYAEYSSFDSSLYYSVTGLNINAKTAANYINSGQIYELFSTGLKGNDKLYGSEFGDYLRGFDGNDSISGGDGWDAIFGDKGKDTLTGGAGVDLFLFNSKPAKSNLDTITDFSAEDAILFDKNIFTNLPVQSDLSSNYVIGTKALDSDDYIIFNPLNNTLYYDADANGKGKMVAVAKIVGVTSLDVNDLIAYPL